ncbi:MAG: right-handed parallel beta-helix repeat-containing protein [Patescibacteria group bacterium]|nr:right-handed parallel beta-helix repeat-containing protein [Patescibacteria group bacterium]
MQKIVTLTVFLSFMIPIVVLGRSYDIYVDASNDSGTEDGTSANPYNTISEGISAALLNDEDGREVYVANGEYQEQVHVEEDVELFGEDRSNTIIIGRDRDDDDFSYAVKMEHGTKIEDFTVKYGNTGILVEEDSRATIEHCKIKSFDKIGVEVLSADRNNKKIFTMEDCKIYKGDGKAMYIRKRKIDIRDNKIYDNEEEGIDLRSKVKGKIYDNEIYDNGESGIEFEMRKTKLKIKGNKIKSNDSSAITAQYRGKNEGGEVLIEDNKLKKNDEFALSCNNPQGGVPPVYYFSSSITMLENALSKNDSGSYAPMCQF